LVPSSTRSLNAQLHVSRFITNFSHVVYTSVSVYELSPVDNSDWCVPIVLPHSVSFIEQVCSTVRPHLSNADRGGGKGWPLRLKTKKAAVLHPAYALLSCSYSPHKVLPSSTSIYIYQCVRNLTDNSECSYTSDVNLLLEVR